MIKAGELDQRVTWQEKTVVVDALNQEVVTWSTLGTTSAKVAAISGSAVHAADQLHAGTAIEVTIRKGTASPQSKFWRGLWQDRILYVEVVLPLPDRDGHRLLCSEGLRDA